ncbi:MAG TPA: tetratricopeptide repeat protein [Thermoanaerobaculia bacterium]|nr:tetratricopeptide repeat protein [Thermoanaerobaculia bacterium]
MNERSKLVPFAPALRRPDPARVAEFADTARRLQRERAASEDLVTSALRNTPRFSWASLHEREELRTSGALERLAQEVEKRRYVDPAASLAIAELATAIADKLRADSYPPIVVAQLRAHAWKDRGQALAFVGRYDEAFDALAKAEQCFEGFCTLAHDRAIVGFVRAIALQEVNRLDESLAIFARCRAVFSDHGDARRRLLCGIFEGMLLQRQHRYREARDIHLPLLAVAHDLGDEESLACLHNLLGHCYVELNDFEAANGHLREAVQRFARLGQPLSAAKAELARGRLLVRTGEHARAIEHLASIRDVFLRHDLIEEAGLCGLDIVEALLATSGAARAESLVRRIIDEFTLARLNTRAITALGYLNEVIAARTASRENVGTVREYILSLRKSPEREFLGLV